MNSFLKFMKKFLSRLFHVFNKVIYKISFFALVNKIILIKVFDPHKAFWIITPEHGNLGDQAIAISELNILKMHKVRFMEITGNFMFELKKKKMLSLLNGNPIIFHGGGYLGTLWFHDEELVREVLLATKKSKVLFFPNTAYFENDENGQKELEKSKRIYLSNEKSWFFAREKKSYDLLREMNLKVGLVPDSVFLLNEVKNFSFRKGCVCLLRSDCERTRTERENVILLEMLNEIFNGQVIMSDTVVPYSISTKKRKYELNKLLDLIRSSELIVTDRLHGMILAAITGTPCILINSKSYKVKGCYEWIKDLDYVVMCDDVSNLKRIYDQIPHGNQPYDSNRLVPLYSKLFERLKILS